MKQICPANADGFKSKQMVNYNIPTARGGPVLDISAVNGSADTGTVLEVSDNLEESDGAALDALAGGGAALAMLDTVISGGVALAPFDDKSACELEDWYDGSTAGVSVLSISDGGAALDPFAGAGAALVTSVWTPTR